MKHTLPVFTATFAVAIWFQVTYSVFSLDFAVPVGSIILFLFTFICLFPKYRRLGAALLGALCGLLFTACYYHAVVRPVSAINERTFTVTATVRAYPQEYDAEQRVTLSVPAEQLGLTARQGNIKTLAYLPLTDEDLAPGDKITAALSFYEPAVSNGFSRKEYYAANGIYTLASYNKDDAGNAKVFVHIPAKRTPAWAYPLHFAARMREGIRVALPEREAGLLTGILLGDTSEMEQHDIQALRKSGLSHVTAVSGMHMGFLVGFFLLVFGKKYGSALSLLAILCFIPMAGASPSVIRAGIMYALTSTAYLISRESDSRNALCIAFLVLVITNPFSAAGAGFQLSFAASLGLILFSTRLQTKLTAPFQQKGRIIKWIAAIIAGSIACSLSALVFTTPILLVRFGYVSALSVIANLLVVSMVGFIFIAGLLLSLCGMFFPALASGIGAALRIPITYVLWVAQCTAAVPYGMIHWDTFWGKAAVIAVYVMALATYALRGRLKTRVLVPVCILFVIGSAAMASYEEQDTLKIICLPAGSGQAVLMHIGKEHTILIDCGASGYQNAAEDVAAHMDWYGRDKIDALILTAADLTHARHVPDLLQSTQVDCIILPPVLRDSELLDTITHTAQEQGIPMLSEPSDVAEALAKFEVRITVFDDIERKLAVFVQSGAKEVLIAHSLTQKMLAELLTVRRDLTCTTLVLSENNISDSVLLTAALEALTPQDIILSAGYSMQDKLLRSYPVRNTNLYGEIVIKTSLSPS